MEPRVNKCCCMNLRTGGMVLGWLGLVAMILHSIMITITPVELYSGIIDGIPYATVGSFDPIRENINKAICLFDVVLSGIMIYGIIKGHPQQMLLPWLIMKATGLVLVAPMCIILTVYVLDDQNLMGIGTIISTLVGLGCWFGVLIFSRYKEIRESTKQPLTVYRRISLYYVPVPPYKDFDNKSYGPNYI